MNTLDFGKRGSVDALDIGVDILDHAIANALAMNGSLRSNTE